MKRGCFWPQPRVDSALIKLSVKEKAVLDDKSQRRLFKIIRASFQQRRKTLRNALAGVISVRKLNRYFNKYNIDKKIRGEDLSLQDFINLSQISADKNRVHQLR
ncbi:MAG: rRNA adenine N-6-methyltransferase family protein [Candidatus Omnitrophota bacterium]